MQAEIQQQLVEEVLELKERKSCYLDAAIGGRTGANYVSGERFQREQTRILRRLPHAAAHSSELPGPNAFRRATVAGAPVLLTRDERGNAHAFLNVCRHRGMRLVESEAGCARRFSCPYHAWTYGNDGAFVAAPHFREGFGELDRDSLGLKRLSCIEKFGFVWVVVEGGMTEDWFTGIASDMDALQLPQLRIAELSTQVHRANWKLLAEGGLESYHFRVAHRNTIGPYFEDNLSTYQVLGTHIRSVLPRRSIEGLAEVPPHEWRLREHANLLYTVFPTSQFLVQQDHVVWIRANPLSSGETELQLATLVPEDEIAGDNADYWSRNHRITLETLVEDFAIGEAIQGNLGAYGEEKLLFGRFEGALEAYNDIIDNALVTGEESVSGEREGRA